MAPDGDRHPRVLSCKLLAVTHATKLTLSIALNPKSKPTLHHGTNPTACLSVHYRHPQQGEMPVISWILLRRHEVGVRGWGK